MKIKSMQMKKIIEKEKGSMAVYVTVVLLGFLIILTVVHSSSASLRKSQLETIIKIKEVYEANYNNIEEIYQDKLTDYEQTLTNAT